MKNSFRAATERMNPQDILAVLRDRYRVQELWDPVAEPGVDLTFDSTVDEWRSACDLVPTRPLGRALNNSFGISASESEWAHLLNSQSTLRDICEFISDAGAKRSPSGPLAIAGKDCSLAGIFVSIRSMLCEAGIPLSNACPSTDLTPFTDDHLGEIVTAVGKLEPGALPLPERRRTPLTSLILLAIFLVALFIATRLYYLLPVLIFVPIYHGLQIRRAKQSFGSIFYFPGIRSLADLTRAIQSHRLGSSMAE